MLITTKQNRRANSIIVKSQNNKIYNDNLRAIVLKDIAFIYSDCTESYHHLKRDVRTNFNETEFFKMILSLFVKRDIIERYESLTLSRITDLLEHHNVHMSVKTYLDSEYHKIQNRYDKKSYVNFVTLIDSHIDYTHYTETQYINCVLVLNDCFKFEKNEFEFNYSNKFLMHEVEQIIFNSLSISNSNTLKTITDLRKMQFCVKLVYQLFLFADDLKRRDKFSNKIEKF